MRRARLDSEERRRGIVAAAMPLFARQGFAGTTTKEISRAAGVSEALVFQHFPSKAALYAQILESGCEGDPGLERLLALEPSTASLVQMVTMMLRHFVLACGGDAQEVEADHRMTLMSYLEDGEYARLVFGWVQERIEPKFRACLQAAARAGDLCPGAPCAANDFWFGHHVAATIAYTRLGGHGVVPYEGDVDAVVADATRFVLRGIGLSEGAIARHHPATSMPAPQPAEAHA